MSSIFAVVAGRRVKYVVLLAWLAIVGASLGMNLPGKFSDAERNESTSFLPGDAESTKALEASTRITGGENVTAVVVYRRDGGLTARDRARIASDIRALDGLKSRFPQLVDQPGAAGVFRRTAVSGDATTALVTGDIRTNGQGKRILDPVDAIRDRVSDPGGG